jgi:ABC-2 type transport system permease protein
MIRTLLRVYWTSLSRDRVAQMMTFLLPIIFFSIFASVFGGRRDATPRVTAGVVDLDHSEMSARLIRALQRESSLRIRTAARPLDAPRGAAEVPLDRARAEAMVRNGDLPVVIVLPAGLDSTLGTFGGSSRPAIEVLADPSDPVAPQMAAGLLQKAAMTAAPDRLARHGFEMMDRYAGGLTPAQHEAMDRWLPMIRAEADSDAVSTGTAGSGSGDRGGFSGLVPVKTTQVVGEKKDNGMVAFYAAGIAVMFLLFMSSAAGGALLDEVESGTLERVLSSRVGMTGMLTGKWLYITLLGTLQIVVMFLWAKMAFKLDFFSHLPGFFVMTPLTAACAAGFGLVLATACRTRQQLSGISTVVILSISAVGGSMFPRFLMSDAMQRMGLLTFNAWALDGYIKVFWRNARVTDLWPQVLVLLAFMSGFLVTARLLARRWERA